MTKDLIEILSWCRGAGTHSEETFVRTHIATIPGIERDPYGNYHLQIGDDPKVLWSCHTDTVTRKEGRQNVKWISKGMLGLHNPKPGSCLGADDGGGVWLCMEMIAAEKPGYYIFHRDEEIGGLGSSFLKNNPEYIPETIQIAIAMDRNGTDSVITHQGWSRCCSQEFGEALARQLGSNWRCDDTGIFTDTANYVGIIPECTNLSIGYEGNHGPRETLDVNHLIALRDALLKLDTDKLPVVRIASDEEDWNFSQWRDEYDSRNYAHTMGYPPDMDDDEWNAPLNIKREVKGLDMVKMVTNHPGVAARLLEELGVDPEEMNAHIFALTGCRYDK